MSYHHNQDGQEPEEDELDEDIYKSQKDALLFAIDVSKTMQKAPPASDDKKADTDSGMTAALKCAYQVMQQRIISNPKDMMGILLFNTEKSKSNDEDEERGSPGYPHCYVYVPLDVPAADDVKKLKSLVEDGEDSEEVLIPSKEPATIKDVLFCANQIMATKAPNFGSRRLFIITDGDNPHLDDKKMNEAAAVRAKDLYDLDPLAELTDPENVLESKSGNDGLSLLKSLIKNIDSKKTPKRAYFSSMPFEIGAGLTISVKGYNLFQKQAPARSCYVWLDDEKAQIAVGETARTEKDSTRDVEKGELKKAYKFGGEYVYFSPEEQTEVKKFGEKTIRIIGFKDRSLLKFWMAIKKSIFIYPSEEGYVGSTRVFSALWQKLVKSKKVGIAWHIARKNANPQLVAIIPSRSQSDEKSGTPYLPAGLWLYPIPFADDVRAGPELQIVRTTNELTDKMNKITGQLQMPRGLYEPHRYPNPALQWHYKILQALALEEEVPDKPDDATVPKNKAISKRAGGYLQEWADVANEALVKHQEQKAIKRELDAEDDEPRPKKRTKTATASKKTDEDGSSAMTDAALKKLVNSGDVTKMKVTELKDALAARSLDTKGRKADLVERLEQWAEENM
ncbi:ATP-dependent DNA helicase II subunit 1 [Apiospora marii]|uniref:ATP-dependent DNA helicase II subunit 1 n=1 Tax=Apiospora marii TaxID=335849 RepID=UPI00312D39D6